MNLDIALAMVLLFSASCYLALGLRLITSKRDVGTAPMGALFVVIFLWVLGGAVELLSTTFYVFSIGRTGHFIGTALLPIAVFVAFREFTATETPTDRKSVV